MPTKFSILLKLIPKILLFSQLAKVSPSESFFLKVVSREVIEEKFLKFCNHHKKILIKIFFNYEDHAAQALFTLLICPTVFERETNQSCRGLELKRSQYSTRNTFIKVELLFSFTF